MNDSFSYGVSVLMTLTLVATWSVGWLADLPLVAIGDFVQISFLPSPPPLYGHNWPSLAVVWPDGPLTLELLMACREVWARMEEELQVPFQYALCMGLDLSIFEPFMFVLHGVVSDSDDDSVGEHVYYGD
eukprot:scaffold191347_cov33-Prasinocladus_malaysianus.AAC.1